VFLRGSAGGTSAIGSVGDQVTLTLLVGDRLLALAPHALVAFDLASKQRTVLYALPSDELPDVTPTPTGQLALVAGRATVLELDQAGHELARPALPIAEGGVELASVLVDHTGRIYVGASGAHLLVVTPQGDASVVPGTGCPDPLRLAPTADGRLV